MQRGSGRIYLLFGAIALAVSGISLAHPSQLSYDSWSWLGWGEEILHGHLSLAGSTSWKPMPVIFTTVFALFGTAAPTLWLLLARAGAVMGILMSVKLAVRLGWELSADARRQRETVAWAAPALLAGVIMVASLFELLVGAPEYLPSVFGAAAVGTSEGLMIAAALMACESAYDGAHRRAFLVGLLPVLDRPEIWILWAPYGIWQMWRDPLMRALVPSLALLVLALWLVPQKLGGQEFTTGLKLATSHHTNVVQQAKCPACTDLKTIAWPLVVVPVRYTSLAAIFVAVPTLTQLSRSRSPLRDWTVAQRATVALSVIAAAGWAWIFGMVAETWAGLSGSQRYMLPGAALLEIASAVFFAWATIAVARVASRVWRPAAGLKPAPGWRRLILAATALACAAFVAVPFWYGSRLASIPVALSFFDYDAKTRTQTAAEVAALGDAHSLGGCGTIVSEPYAIPMLSFYLDIPARAMRADGSQNSVQRNPHLQKGRWPAVIAQYRYTPHMRWTPRMRVVHTWERESGHSYHELKGSNVRLYVDCKHPTQA